jgi:hypothetical protein
MSEYLWCRRWFGPALAFICLQSPLQAAEFKAPDMAGFIMHDEREADGDGDGVKETQVQQYLNPQGDSAFSLTTGGRLWAWSLDTRNDESGPKNYVIRDSDCDGVFDEVYGLSDEFHVPDCTRQPAP